MAGIEESWDVCKVAIEVADKVADHAQFLSYTTLLPDMVRAFQGIGEVPGEMIDLDATEEKELYARGTELAKSLGLGDEVVYEDVDDGLTVAMCIKSIVLRHRQAKAATKENDSTKAAEPK
jgi:hypothetical protein